MSRHGKKPFARQVRVAEQIRRELAPLIVRVVRQPGFEWVTLSDVEVSRDYAVAKVFYTLLQSEKLEEIQSGLDEHAGRLRSELGKRIRLFQTPRLVFVYDPSIERGAHINALIRQVFEEPDGISDDSESSPKEDDSENQDL